jgi:hypothetical protein
MGRTNRRKELPVINPQIVHDVDKILDDNVSDYYKQQPLAQHWARIAKVIEEAGETISELILYTGQNPRKGEHPEHYWAMLMELADTAMTTIYAIQHFTKDVKMTEEMLGIASTRHLERLQAASEH